MRKRKQRGGQRCSIQHRQPRRADVARKMAWVAPLVFARATRLSRSACSGGCGACFVVARGSSGSKCRRRSRRASRLLQAASGAASVLHDRAPATITRKMKPPIQRERPRTSPRPSGYGSKFWACSGRRCGILTVIVLGLVFDAARSQTTFPETAKARQCEPSPCTRRFGVPLIDY